MPVKVLKPTQEQINELRNLFNESYDRNPPAVPFHHVDIERLRNDDVWCRRFLEMHDLNIKVAFEKLWETCIWRMQYGAYDLSEANLRMEYLRDGIVFAHNKDVDGKPLLIFRTRLHVKGARDMDELMRVVVYWIERIQRETPMEQITLFFDMAGTGLAGMDVDFVRRIIDTFKMYYPNCLNYILIYEMAWILNAAFKIIKGFLPPKALEILKVISKKDINTYVDKQNCLRSWGGDDNYEFQFEPEKIQQSTATTTITTTSTSTTTGHKSNGVVPTAVDDLQSAHDKKVHFANCSPTRPSTDMKEVENHYTPQDYDMLRISPSDCIQFPRGDNSESTLEITSTSKCSITYKIQTTSPEKFRVRPRCGVLGPGESVSVCIVLKADCHLSENSKDKFLIMCMMVPQGADMSPQRIADVWKHKPPNSSDIEQHRLCCSYKGAGDIAVRTGLNGKYSEISEVQGSNTVADLTKQAKQLECRLKFTQWLQCLTLLLLIALSVAVVYLLRLESVSKAGKLDDEACKAGCGGCLFGK